MEINSVLFLSLLNHCLWKKICEVFYDNWIWIILNMKSGYHPPRIPLTLCLIFFWCQHKWTAWGTYMLLSEVWFYSKKGSLKLATVCNNWIHWIPALFHFKNLQIFCKSLLLVAKLRWMCDLKQFLTHSLKQRKVMGLRARSLLPFKWVTLCHWAFVVLLAHLRVLKVKLKLV